MNIPGLPFSLNIDEGQVSALFKQLSGSILEKLTENSPAFTQLLSATHQMQELSAVPHHPYEAMKYDLFGPEHKFLSIEDISVPENYDLKKLTEGIESISKQIQSTAISAASAFQTDVTNITGKDINNFNYNFLNQNTFDVNLARKNIEFSEVVKSLTVEQIKAQPLQIAQKLVSHFVALYQ